MNLICSRQKAFKTFDEFQIAEIVRSSNVVKSECELCHIPVGLYVSVKAELDAVVFAVSACRTLMPAMM